MAKTKTSAGAWTVEGVSESGDHYIAAFRKKPTELQLSNLVHEWDGAEEKDGPGYDGSYVHINVNFTAWIPD